MYGICIYYVLLQLALTAVPSIHGEAGKFPKCEISKGVTFTQHYDEEHAQEQCQQYCKNHTTYTRYGLMKYAQNYQDTGNVGCSCGPFEFADESEFCTYTCGSHNVSCGGPREQSQPESHDPFHVSVYPVCDPYDNYGKNCSIRCPAHCSDGCLRSDGTCHYGCIAGWEQTRCQEPCPHNCKDGICSMDYCSKGCADGFYGHQYCAQKCPENCLNKTCDETNGHCPDSRCKDGYFGPVCASKCPQNCSGSSCDSSGFCHGGCNNGWFGSVCSTPCPKHCVNATCHSVHGACTHGCLDGWFGTVCGVPCPQNCNSTLCNSTDGVCTNGCKANFFGIRCSNPCPEHCLDGVCDFLTGECTEGCMPGWEGDKCISEESTGPLVPGWASGTMVGLFLGGVVLSGLVTYFVVVFRRRRSNDAGQFHTLPEDVDEDLPHGSDSQEVFTTDAMSQLEPLV